MMDFVAQAAKIVITILGTKALERIGTKLPDILTEKIRKFTASLEQISPDTAKALKLAPEQPLNSDRVEREIIAAARNNPEFKEILLDLEKAIHNYYLASKGQQNIINNDRVNRFSKKYFSN